MNPYATLGAPEDVNLEAWSQYITTLRDSLRASWRSAKSAYFTLQEIRTQFNLPFIADPVVTEGGVVVDQGGWTTELQNGMLRLQQVVEALDQIATDALDNKRRLGWNAQNVMVIERLPSDNVTVQVVNGWPELVGDTGNVVPPSTGAVIQPLGVGFPPLAIVAIVGIAAVSVYFSVEAICSAVEKTAEEKTNQTLGSQQKELVESGKATPAEAAQMTSAILKGRAEIKKSEAAAAEQKPTAQLASTARTLGFVALGLAAVWLAVTFIQRAPSRSPAMARNPTRRRKNPRKGQTLYRVWRSDVDDDLTFSKRDADAFASSIRRETSREYVSVRVSRARRGRYFVSVWTTAPSMSREIRSRIKGAYGARAA